MELRHYLSVVRKYIIILLILPFVAGAISLAVSLQLRPIYEVSTTLLINPVDRSADLDYTSLLTVERVGSTYAELLKTRSLLEQVIAQLNLSSTYNQLADRISITRPANTQLILIHVQDGNPRIAVDIANAIAATFEMQNSQRRIGDSFYVEVVEPAALPARQVQPRPFLSTALAAAAGFALGLGLVFLLDYLDLTIGGPEIAEKTLRVPTLATIPIVRLRNPDKIATLTDSKPTLPFSEAFRMLRTNLTLTRADDGLQSLLITSALASEGKSSVVVNLGIAMAQVGLRVLLVDADLRHPSLHHLLEPTNEKGLVDLLQTDCESINSFVVQTQVPQLFLLPAGRKVERPAEILGSDLMSNLIAKLCADWEVVLIDSSPIMAVTDPVILSSKVDGVLIVIRAGQTPRDVAQRALGALQTVEANVVGTVLNRLRTGGTKYYYHSQETKKVSPLEIYESVRRRFAPRLTSGSPEDNA